MNIDATDKWVAVTAAVVLVAIAVSAFGLMAFNHEAVGETIEHESEQLDVPISEYFHRQTAWTRDDCLNQNISAFMINSVSVGEKAYGGNPNLEIWLEIPSNGKAFRYLSIEYDAPEANFVIPFYDDGFALDYWEDTSGSAKYSMSKGDPFEHDTQTFDFEFTLDSDITVKYRIGQFDGEKVDEQVFTFTYHLVPSEPSS